MGTNPGNHGKKIGEIVHSALQSGDLSRLKDLGPAVKDAVGEIPGLISEAAGPGNGNPPDKNTSSRQPAGHPYQQPPRQRPMWQGSAVPTVKTGGNAGGLVRTVFGVLGMVAFGLGGLSAASFALALPLQPLFWPLAIGCGALFAASGGLLASGIGQNKLARRGGEYAALFEKKKVYSFEELAAEVGRTPVQIKKDFRRLRAKGFFEDVRTDADESCVMKGEETYRLYLEAEKAKRQREDEREARIQRFGNETGTQLEQFRAEGARTIRQIRSANDAIPGEEISEKLQQLEDTTARIFAYVEEYPEKLPDTRKFMSYYLPTTLKLVEKYREYEKMAYQPENIRQAKLEIERALGTINTAFTNLLESFFQHDTLDVTTDIEVLEKMLEQEGLTGRQFEIGEDDDLIELKMDMEETDD